MTLAQENKSRTKTFLRQLVALSSVYNILVCTFVLPGLTHAVFSGGARIDPIPCRVSQLLIVWAGISLVLVPNELAALRYLYSCRLGALGTVNEGLALRFLVLWNSALSAVGSAALVAFLDEEEHCRPDTTEENVQGRVFAAVAFTVRYGESGKFGSPNSNSPYKKGDGGESRFFRVEDMALQEEGRPCPFKGEEEGRGGGVLRFHRHRRRHRRRPPSSSAGRSRPSPPRGLRQVPPRPHVGGHRRMRRFGCPGGGKLGEFHAIFPRNVFRQ